MAVVPFRRRRKTRGRRSAARSVAASSAKSAVLSLANKLQILALEHEGVVRVLESIVDGALEELRKER